jgi:hypothetical protein
VRPSRREKFAGAKGAVCIFPGMVKALCHGYAGWREKKIMQENVQNTLDFCRKIRIM